LEVDVFLKGVGDGAKNGFAGVIDRRSFAVHDPPGPHDPSAKDLADALMSETNAKDGNFSTDGE
jgi:hypothetical protein